MIDPATPYRHHEIYTPAIAPFNTAGALLWPTVIGVFLKPVIEFTEMPFWFCDHGPDFQFCFAHANYAAVEQVIEQQKQTFNATSKVLPNNGQTVATAFRGTRWIETAKLGDEAKESRRSTRVFAFLAATSALYFDSLVPEGIHWRREHNSDPENPLHNGFESLAHLLANISKFEFELLPNNLTAWMAMPRPRLHL